MAAVRAILPSGEAGSADDAQMIDLEGGYLMPGLWDVHIHPDYLSLDEMPLAPQVSLFGYRLATALTESGIVPRTRHYTPAEMKAAAERAPVRRARGGAGLFCRATRIASRSPTAV